MVDYTTISCTEEIRGQVKSKKRGGESYNEVLARLLDAHDELQKQEATSPSPTTDGDRDKALTE